jgi:hypothetical protein
MHAQCSKTTHFFVELLISSPPFASTHSHCTPALSDSSSHTTRNIMDSAKPIEPQATGVPADFVDPNHPHFPHDVEAQPFERPYYKYFPSVSKKTANVIAIGLLVVLSYLTAILVGGKIGMGMVKQPAPLPVVNETVYATTTVFSTTVIPYTLKQNATTSTVQVTVTVTPTPSIDLFPVAPAFSWTPTPASSTPSPSAESPKGKNSVCFWTGRWSTLKECEDKCVAMDDKSTNQKPVCGEERGFHRCQTCKAS